jgi:prepilin-type N-terminal cleavage/methylation domain-containing protein
LKQIPDTVRTGFTLVELLLVVAVLAVMVSITIPRIGWSAMGKVEAKTSAREFSDHLKLARSLAITHASTNSNGYKVVLSGPFTSYSLINVATLATVKGPIDIPQGVICSGDSEFMFTPLGQLQGFGTLAVQFSKSGNIFIVTATSVGRVTIE